MNAIRIILPILLLISAATAQAQLYKWVGPDGKVTYSDTPPPSSAREVEEKSVNAGSGGGVDLPFEVAEAAKNHPVTLYTGKQCAPCDEGRALLKKRGIPFREKTVSSNEDIAKLREVGGTAQLPLLLIGRSKQTGMNASAWTTALSAAGYPETSKLPKTYRAPAPEAAAPSPVAAKAAASAQQSAAQPVEDLPPATGNAPPGFRF